jgi:hypothetical protein
MHAWHLWLCHSHSWELLAAAFFMLILGLRTCTAESQVRDACTLHSANEYFRINKGAKSQPHEKYSRLFILAVERSL